MYYRKRESLAVITVNYDCKSIPFSKLEQTILNNPSYCIYCINNERLIGIVSAGDISRAEGDTVWINKSFTYVLEGQYMAARTIFKEKLSIHALPVLSKDGILTGEYIRWDDVLQVRMHLNTFGKGAKLKLQKLTFSGGGEYYYADNHSRIVLVKPCVSSKEKQTLFHKIQKRLQSHGIAANCITHEEIKDYLPSTDAFLFIDENECQAMNALLSTIWKKGLYLGFQSYVNTFTLSKDDIDKQDGTYLTKLYEQGIQILGLTAPENEDLEKAIFKKFSAVGEERIDVLPKSMYKGFFADLYNEQYIEDIYTILNMRKVRNEFGLKVLEDHHSRLYNVTNGERHTVGQPTFFTRNIFFFGPCYIVGNRVEDKHTIASFLQKRLNEENYPVRVVNCGSIGMEYLENCIPRIMKTVLHEGDIIILDRPPEGIRGVKYLNLTEVLVKNEVNVEWMTNAPFHCNHKITELYANAIYETLAPVLENQIPAIGKLIENDNDFIKRLYLNRYFQNFQPSMHGKIGAIVMNCNPFTCGHRYLIEQALHIIDFLIIFVVEEDKSVFSFTERFAFVYEGTKDLNNIMVVPSGPFILTQMSFPEYFIKETSEDIKKHTEQDIRTFAEKIAPPLGIKYRFIGEETNDEVTNQYNLAMKKILPEYGIQPIEIPRKEIGGEQISASLVRKCIEENKTETLEMLVPESTLKILFRKE